MSEESYDRLKEKYYNLIGFLTRIFELLPKTARRRNRFVTKES